jgi:hypothetical protein
LLYSRKEIGGAKRKKRGRLSWGKKPKRKRQRRFSSPLFKRRRNRNISTKEEEREKQKSICRARYIVTNLQKFIAADWRKRKKQRETESVVEKKPWWVAKGESQSWVGQRQQGGREGKEEAWLMQKSSIRRPSIRAGKEKERKRELLSLLLYWRLWQRRRSRSLQQMKFVQRHFDVNIRETVPFLALNFQPAALATLAALAAA